jgi:hypothetical protein
MSYQGDGAETLEGVGGLQGEHRSGEEAGEHDDGQGAHADRVGLQHHVGKVERFAEEIGDGLTAEQNVILNCQDSFLDEFGGRSEFHAARSAAAALGRNYNRKEASQTRD